MEEIPLTDAEAQKIEDETQIEVYPVPTEYPLYECPQGHRQRGSGETTAKNAEFPDGVSTGEVCIQCFILSQVGLFPTKRVEE